MRRNLGRVERYANAFRLDPGKCFRFVATEAARGQPVPCTEPVVARGRWRDGAGSVRVVEACAAHAGELEAAGRPSRPGSEKLGGEVGDR
ncbi:MAG: hypothetical protein M0T71_14725 [Actinomycetota bacterium]|nr:hypothetical protein [Actinomycetota bacterium]